MIKDIILKLGFALVFIGVAAIESEKVLIPIAMIIIGFILMFLGIDPEEYKQWQK